jgi:uncharacterized membrane protein YecN with MAPEG domain
VQVPTITAIYLALLAFVYIALGLQVIRLRRREGIAFGDGGSADLRSAIRAHAHFAETVPVIMLMAALLEATGLPAATLYQWLSALFVARLIHPIGMYAKPQSWQFGIFRVGGMTITIGVMFLCAKQIIHRFWLDSFLAGLDVPSWPSFAQLPFRIVTHTPWWVFVAFALVIWGGIQALQPRTRSVGQLLITPSIFLAWGIASLVTRSSSSASLLASWSIAAAGFGAFAWLAGRFSTIGVDPTRRLLSLPGSAIPLTRDLLVFTAKYGLAIAFALAQELRHDIEFWNILVSGASAGYFSGWAIRLVSIYRQALSQRAPISDLKTEMQKS